MNLTKTNKILLLILLNLTILINLIVVLHPNWQIGGDGYGYYTYLRSLAFDRDFDFKNEFQQFDDLYGTKMAPRITKIGRVGNQFSIGPSIFWTPFFLVGHFANKLSPTIGDYQLPGFNAPYQIAVSFGSIIYFLIGLVFLYQGLKKFFSEKLAFWLTSISWLISPLVYYLVYEPSMSHALDFFILTILFYYFIKFRDNNRPNNLIVLGIILGLAMLIRWQNLLFGLLPLYLIFQSANKLKSACYFLLAVFLIFSPQLLMWKYLYGSSILAPQGSNFFNLFTPHLGKFLFSGYHGLFIWHPLLIFGVIGLLLAFKKQVVWYYSRH